MISKHERAYEARGAQPREFFTAFECFDIMGKHECKVLICFFFFFSEHPHMPAPEHYGNTQTNTKDTNIEQTSKSRSTTS